MKYVHDQTEDDKYRVFLAGELAGMNCQCGRRKQSGRAFCFKCHNRLPQGLSRGMYRKIGDGLCAAYKAAHLFLNTPREEGENIHEKKRQANV